MPFLGERHQNIFMVSWTCRRALLNWPTLRSGGVFRLRGATAISQQARAAEGLLGKMSSRSILEGELLWQDLAVMHPPGRSPMAKCSRNAFPRRPTVARYRCGVFSGCRPWQYFAVVRFRGSSRGEIMPWCVPGRRSVAAFSLHAFPKGPRTGKAPVRGNISPPCIQNGLASARYARHASEKPRKRAFGDAPREDLARKGPFSLRVPLKSCTARRSCHSWVLRLSALIFLGWGGAAETMRTVRRPAQDVPAVAPPCMRPCALSALLGLPASSPTCSFFLPAALSSRPRRDRTGSSVSFTAENVAL